MTPRVHRGSLGKQYVPLFLKKNTDAFLVKIWWDQRHFLALSELGCWMQWSAPTTLFIWALFPTNNTIQNVFFPLLHLNHWVKSRDHWNPNGRLSFYLLFLKEIKHGHLPNLDSLRFLKILKIFFFAIGRLSIVELVSSSCLKPWKNMSKLINRKLWFVWSAWLLGSHWWQQLKHNEYFRHNRQGGSRAGWHLLSPFMRHMMRHAEWDRLRVNWPQRLSTVSGVSWNRPRTSSSFLSFSLSLKQHSEYKPNRNVLMNPRDKTYIQWTPWTRFSSNPISLLNTSQNDGRYST